MDTEIKKIQGKTLIVNPILHKNLMMIKVNEDYTSIDELISDLLEKRNELKVVVKTTKKKK
jgi:hypothetical protein